MAVLSNQDRADIFASVMRKERILAQPLDFAGSLSKADLRAAVDAIDQWISDNAAAFNSAIPQPARGALSAAQKASIFSAVVAKRFEKGT